MAEFKRQLEEMVDRGKLEIDFATFRDLCVDCQIANPPAANRTPTPSSVQEGLGDVGGEAGRSPAPSASNQALLPDSQLRKEYRRLVDPDRLMEDAEWAAATVNGEQFLAAMRRIAAQLYPAAAGEAEALDKLVRRVQRSSAARANLFCARAEAEFVSENYELAEKLFTAVRLALCLGSLILLVGPGRHWCCYVWRCV